MSAALKASSWPGVVVRWVDMAGGLLKSQGTEAEVLAVLQRPRFASRLPPFYIVNVRRMLAAAELVAIVEPVVECRDPKDDKFLELALNGRADAIVSGDADLLAADPFRGIPILDPAAIWRAVVA